MRLVRALVARHLRRHHLLQVRDTHAPPPPPALTEAHALLGEDVDAPLTPLTEARVFPLTVPWAWLVLWCGCCQESRGRQLRHHPRCECPSFLSACLFVEEMRLYLVDHHGLEAVSREIMVVVWLWLAGRADDGSDNGGGFYFLLLVSFYWTLQVSARATLLTAAAGRGLNRLASSATSSLWS